MLPELLGAAQTNIRPPRSDTRINKCIGLIEPECESPFSRRERRSVRFRRIIIRSRNVIADLRYRDTAANKRREQAKYHPLRLISAV
jgi:hypothetical protein